MYNTVGVLTGHTRKIFRNIFLNLYNQNRVFQNSDIHNVVHTFSKSFIKANNNIDFVLTGHLKISKQLTQYLTK